MGNACGWGMHVVSGVCVGMRVGEGMHGVSRGCGCTSMRVSGGV